MLAYTISNYGVLAEVGGIKPHAKPLILHIPLVLGKADC